MPDLVHSRSFAVRVFNGFVRLGGLPRRLGHNGSVACRGKVLLVTAVLLGPALAQEADRHPGAIEDVQAFSHSLGIPDTRNFRHGSNKSIAAYRCYFTGKLELPESYEGLQLRHGDASGCRVDGDVYDVFYYPVEAVASGNEPVTSSLANAGTERLLVVVPHEDAHGLKDLERLGPSLSEAAVTLAGFRTAEEYARSRYSTTSAVYRNMVREPELFLAKARIVNRYWSELSALYAAVRAGSMSSADAIARKAQVFDRLAAECRAIAPKPVSFNACPAVMNNAGLAFDFTYTRYYPLVYELHRKKNWDVRATLEALEQIGREVRGKEAESARRVEQMIESID